MNFRTFCLETQGLIKEESGEVMNSNGEQKMETEMEPKEASRFGYSRADQGMGGKARLKSTVPEVSGYWQCLNVPVSNAPGLGTESLV